MRNLAVVTVTCVAFAGCQKAKPSKVEEAPSNAETSSQPLPPLANRTRLQLPTPSGKPPIKTTGVFDQAMMDKIGQPSFDGWEKIPHGGTNGHVQVRHQTKDHPKVMVEVTIDPCKDTCTPIELAKWQDPAKQGEIKTALFDPNLTAAPDTTWDLGQTDINGVPAISIYVLGQAIANGGAYADAYMLFYNDGANQMRVIARYADDPMRTKEMMTKYVPRELLEKLAKTFMDVYGQIW